MADVAVDPENNNPKELKSQGIRAYYMQDYAAAVAAFSKTSELLASEHGDDLHESLADVYLYYGKALLGLSRENSEALGDAVPKNADEESEEDEGIETEDGEQVKNEDSDEKTNGEISKSTEEEASKNENSETVEDNTLSSKDAPGTSEGQTEDNEAVDEPTDLQVAWEVLELAKKIYREKFGDDGLKFLADALIVLGEVSLESENFDSAVSDIKEGLEIQKNLFGNDSRTVAETYYKLGIACSANSQIDDAIQNFRASLQCLENRINILEKAEDKKSEDEDEIQEIKNLTPDIEEKICDMLSYKEEVCDLKNLVIECVAKPKFGNIDNKACINKLEVKRKPTLDSALAKLN